MDARSVGLGLLTLVLWCVVVAHACGADVSSWELRTDDTEIRLAVVDDRPVVQRLGAVGSPQNWIAAPAAGPLLAKVWIDGREVPLAWKFRDGTLDKGTSQLTLVFSNDDPRLLLRSIWRARPGRGPIEHRM